MEVRPLEPRDAAACDAIVVSLPEWFGMQEGIDDCAIGAITGRSIAQSPKIAFGFGFPMGR